MDATTTTAVDPLVRVVHAGLGFEGQVRVVLSNVSDPARLQRPWASSGATVELVDGRLHAVTTVQALSRAAGRSLSRDEAALIDARLRDAVQAWSAPARSVPLTTGPTSRLLRTDHRPLVMGVVNVTPDSFSDGGALYGDGAGPHPDTAVAHARRLVEEGADVVDVGGESSRPGAEPVDVAEELERVVAVVEAIADETVVSIDTTKPEVARAAVAAGAAIVNDVSGARERALLDVVASTGAAYVLMHSRGTPRDMQEHASYDDVVAEVYEALAAGLRRCADAGISEDRIVVDVGIGFAKQAEHNLALLRELRQLRGLGRPVLVGASRKSFLGAVLGGAPPEERVEASLACAVGAVRDGAAMVRVHDVAPTVAALRTAHAVASGVTAWVPATTER